MSNSKIQPLQDIHIFWVVPANNKKWKKNTSENKFTTITTTTAIIATAIIAITIITIIRGIRLVLRLSLNTNLPLFVLPVEKI